MFGISITQLSFRTGPVFAFRMFTAGVDLHIYLKKSV